MNLPADFINSIRLLLKDETESFLKTIEGSSPVSVRLNPLKCERKPADLLDSGEIAGEAVEERVAWSEYGYYLKKRPSFTFDPLFHSGSYYVQEASSMFIEYIVRQLVDKPTNCLDLCAAPGGKSLSLLSGLPAGSFLNANEIIRQRANILSENIIKFGNPNTLVTNNEPKDFAVLKEFYDLILVDAPCSGEGMFRKDEVAVREWSMDNVIMCASRQKNILADVWPSLKPGGMLIYSTCTYNTAENEEVALWAVNELGGDFIEIDTKNEWGISSSLNSKVIAYRFFPHRSKGEGLFVVVLRKSLNEYTKVNLNQLNTYKGFTKPDQKVHRYRRAKKDRNNYPLSIKESSIYKKYLNKPDSFDYIQEDNIITAIPKEHSRTFSLLRDTFKVVSMGIELGKIKGKDFIPSHSLAMSCNLNRESFTTRDVSYEDAISYLRKVTINIPDAPKGFILLTYKNKPLGFVKNIGNRANNIYPDKWCIRT